MKRTLASVKFESRKEVEDLIDMIEKNAVCISGSGREQGMENFLLSARCDGYGMVIDG